jgi:AraC-like DNA-binding protein
MGIKRALNQRRLTAELVASASRHGHDVGGMLPLQRPPDAFMTQDLPEGLRFWAADFEAGSSREVEARYACPMFCSLILEGHWHCQPPGGMPPATLCGGDIALYALQPQQVWLHRPLQGGRLCSLGVEVPQIWVQQLQHQGSPLAAPVSVFLSHAPALRQGRASSALRARALASFRADRTRGSHRLRLQAVAYELMAEALALLETDPSGVPGVAWPLRTAAGRPGSLSIADRQRAEQLRQLLDQRYAEPWTLTSLAQAIGSSAGQLNDCFRAAFGDTVFGYLQRLRLHRAHALLHQGFNVTQTTFEVGYAHVGSFSRAFKAHFGFSPGEVARGETPGP